jgi:hypothetical protein
MRRRRQFSEAGTTVTSVRPLSPSARLLTSAAVLATLGLSGCAGTGVDAQTNEQYQAGVGANVRTGAIQLFNALAVDNGNGTATLSAAILNTTNEAARLTAATAKDANGSAVATTLAPAIVGAGQMFDTGKPGAVLLTSKKVTAGDYVTVKLTFSGGHSVTVDAPVVPRTAIYDKVAGGSGGEELPVKSAENPGA